MILFVLCYKTYNTSIIIKKQVKVSIVIIMAVLITVIINTVIIRLGIYFVLTITATVCQMRGLVSVRDLVSSAFLGYDGSKRS